MSDRTKKQTLRPHLWLIPHDRRDRAAPLARRLETGVGSRVALSRSDAFRVGQARLAQQSSTLLRRSLGAFWDALWFQSYRWEDEMIQDLRYGSADAAQTTGLHIYCNINTGARHRREHCDLQRCPHGIAAPAPVRRTRAADCGVETGHDRQAAPFVELSVAEFKDWEAQNQSFESMAVMPTTSYGYGYVMTGRGEAVQLESSKVTSRFLLDAGRSARARSRL